MESNDDECKGCMELENWRFLLYVSSTVVNSLLWHARLGHMHYKRTLEMSKDDLIPAINENPRKYTTFMLMKITRKPFKSITRRSVILELIHSDLCDFHGTPSLGNKKYVITFIDDASRFCYVYLLHAKDEALDKFRIYKTEVDLQQNDLVITLCTDTCGEYYDPVFFQFVGIIHETTAPYTPQENGVAERKNRALKEMVNSMLSYSGLSEGFWGEAMLTACYLLNRVPNKRNKTTPYELWYKKRPNLAFLRVSGCRAVVRLPDLKRKTLGEKELRDAIFDENCFSLTPRPKDTIPNSDESQRDDHSDVPNEIPEPHKGNEHKVCKLIKSLYGLKQAPKQWHQKFDDVVLSSGFHLNQSNKCVYSKFDDSDKGVIICLHVDDMLIFGTDQNQVDKTKKFLSSMFSMKDMGEADVIIGIKIKRENKGIVITQSHYIEKILKKINHEDCSLVSTPMDPVEKLKPNTCKPVDQLEYSRAIGCLMYAMTSTRPDIAYAVGRLSRFTSNPSRQYWKAITRVFKYLRGTLNYCLSFVVHPPVLEAYSDASWINHVEDSSSTSGWVFLLGGGAISWASKKQTCITGFTVESEFVALAAAGKEA
uniref:Zinc finger, CCHC-type n=1 Tax=Tanacetum cinerariifolium TaxID=118510 RepID=A0A6L2LMQ9_TANCI|nr:zinc finger, CCHC-type [Tanacetum cinerariifolium]